MWSVRDLAVAALVVIVVEGAVALAFPLYKPVARDNIEFGPSGPIAARDGTHFWKHLMHPKFDMQKPTDDSKSSYDFHNNDVYKQPISLIPAGTPPPAYEENVNKNDQRPTKTQQIMFSNKQVSR
ncbi:hypothetical protein O3G_MSEX003211 [Manduca sexta]|uniref:Uncharacterized protein n=1 Tax=Manduca sexta TaxID=7130 RepID=A0A922CFE6_MANSE|nr:hypothetical protein O3G_MSEX003211 [Manduca sexta]